MKIVLELPNKKEGFYELREDKNGMLVERERSSKFTLERGVTVVSSLDSFESWHQITVETKEGECLLRDGLALSKNGIGFYELSRTSNSIFFLVGTEDAYNWYYSKILPPDAHKLNEIYFGENKTKVSGAKNEADAAKSDSRTSE